MPTYEFSAWITVRADDPDDADRLMDEMRDALDDHFGGTVTLVDRRLKQIVDDGEGKE